MIKYIILLPLLSICLSQFGQQTIDSVALSNLVKATNNTHTDGLVIWNDGKVILEEYSNNDDKMIALHSVQKSLINLCIGKLILDKKLDSIDTPIYYFYPEWHQSLKKEITIRHILSHTSGLDQSESNLDWWNAENIILYALCAQVKELPGTTFRYNTLATFLLHGIVEKLSGKRLDLYMASELFVSLGIKNYRWDYDSVGNPKLLYMAASDLLKIGQLVINEGNWNGQLIVSKEWLNKSFQSSQKDNPECGLLWWLIPESKLYTIDDNLLKLLKDKGVKEKFIKKYSKLKGVYNSHEAVVSKMIEIYGTEYWKELDFKNDHSPYTKLLYIKTISKVLGYQAIGMLGQYLVIYPDKKLVAVRMIKVSSYKGEADEMYNFNEYVNNLIKE